ncbi:MAG: PhnD/SsuA/transferrin family substrate-binding protein [Gammaproteobacteria bacterium]|nr:PhnD/SsuA/transferrin family substrate-binding protein [Gammaproteobacteria bacterium]
MKRLFFVLCALLTISTAVADSRSLEKPIHNNADAVIEVTIGVLAYEGKQHAKIRWQPTADYLSSHIPGHRFQVLPLTHVEFENEINKGKLDFILTNPGHYVRIEVAHGATRIATFMAKFHDQILTHFSSVIFTRSDSDISRLVDFKGRTLAAVSEEAFGGYQLAQKALQEHNIDIRNDVTMQWLGFPHADVVTAVLTGRADAGTVRSGTLEEMAAQGKLELSQLRIIAQQHTGDFPLLHSVDLYPEWPFAKLPETDGALAKQVAIALFNMQQGDDAARKSAGAGWTIPLDYTPVHDVFRYLKIEPYLPAALDLAKFWQAYRHWIVVVIILFFISLLALLRLYRTNQKLQSAQQALHNHQTQLEEVVALRTEELHQSNQALQQEVASHIRSEQTLNEGCETLHSLYSIFLRNDLDRKQRLHSIVDLLRQHLGTEFALLSSFQGDQFITCASSPANTPISTPLSKQLSQQALQNNQLFTQENDSHWYKYVACPIYVAGDLHCLFEFATSHQYYQENGIDKNSLSSELSLRILNLLSQWVGNETLLLEKEKLTSDRHNEIRVRFRNISPREYDVLKLLVQGESSKTMAKILNISTKTIELHRANILHKTKSKSSTELVQLAVLSNILE